MAQLVTFTTLSVCQGEYQLLTEMNRRTHAKYQQMRTVGQETQTAIEQLNAKYTELEPCLRSVTRPRGGERGGCYVVLQIGCG